MLNFLSKQSEEQSKPLRKSLEPRFVIIPSLRNFTYLSRVWPRQKITNLLSTLKAFKHDPFIQYLFHSDRTFEILSL